VHEYLPPHHLDSPSPAISSFCDGESFFLNIKHLVDFFSVVRGGLLYRIFPRQREGISKKNVMPAPAGILSNACSHFWLSKEKNLEKKSAWCVTLVKALSLGLYPTRYVKSMNVIIVVDVGCQVKGVHNLVESDNRT
jgi:hypothetical protein